MRTKLDVIFLLFINLIPTVALPLLNAQYKWMSEPESIILAIIILISFSSAELLWKVDSIQDAEAGNIELWEAENEFDLKLSNARVGYQKILTIKRDAHDLLFKIYFDAQAKELDKEMREATHTQKLHLTDANVINVNTILDCLDGGQTVLRLVHYLEDTNFLLGLYGSPYFERIYKLIGSKKIKEVRRLIISKDEKELQDIKSQKLIHFHETNYGYSYKILKDQYFRGFVHDHQIYVPRDFGVYGDKYTYIGEINDLENVKGHIYQEPEVVKNYIDFFDYCWNHRSAIKQKNKGSSKKMDIASLFTD